MYGRVKVDVLEVRQIELLNRATAKQGTDLQDIARLILDEQARPAALAQFGNCDPSVAADIALHVDLWLVDRRRDALRWIHDTGGTDLTLDDLDLITELLLSARAIRNLTRGSAKNSGGRRRWFL